VPPKSYYDLLELPPTSSQDDVKKAFRLQIARYHPDKVHHLGKEFQEMAAERAAELTEAYRVLSDEGRRAAYDCTLGATQPGRAAAPPGPSAPTAPPTASSTSPGGPQAAHADERAAFTKERATRDEWFLKAAISRFRQALAVAGSSYEESPLRGFDVASVPRSRLFGSGKQPRLLGRFVATVDGAAVAEAWTQAARCGATSGDEICVFLMGTSLAPSRELADAIAEQRRRTRSKVTLIPVDARDWEAHVPTDAPGIAKTILTRLKSGT
jgi:curved DNA-binding protein CbpA